MKKVTKKIKNGYIVTTCRSEGNYSTINNEVLNDTRLSDSAVRLMIMLVNIPPTQKISMTYYRKKLGWGSEKMSKITKKLAELGYLKGIQYPQGEKFKYHYNIDESGELKPKYDDNGDVVVLKNSTKPYSKKEHHKKKQEIINETVTNPPTTNNIVDYITTHTPIEVIENYQNEFSAIMTNHTTYNEQVIEVNNLNKKIKLECYNYNTNFVKGKLTSASPTANKKFTTWLKNEIFDKYNLNINASNKLKHFKQQFQNKPKVKIHYEDKLQAISEQPND